MLYSFLDQDQNFGGIQAGSWLCQRTTAGTLQFSEPLKGKWRSLSLSLSLHFKLSPHSFINFACIYESQFLTEETLDFAYWHVFKKWRKVSREKLWCVNMGKMTLHCQPDPNCPFMQVQQTQLLSCVLGTESFATKLFAVQKMGGRLCPLNIIMIF